MGKIVPGSLSFKEALVLVTTVDEIKAHYPKVTAWRLNGLRKELEELVLEEVNGKESTEAGVEVAREEYADGKLIILDEKGTLTMVKASPKAFEVLSSFKLFDLGEKKKSWTLPILVGKRLYARDNDTIVALDLG